MYVNCSDPVYPSVHISHLECLISYAGDEMYWIQRYILHVPDFLGLYNSPTFPDQPPYLNGFIFVLYFVGVYITFVLIPACRIARIIKRVCCGQMPDPKEQREQVSAILRSVPGPTSTFVLTLWFSCFTTRCLAYIWLYFDHSSYHRTEPYTYVVT